MRLCSWVQIEYRICCKMEQLGGTWLRDITRHDQCDQLHWKPCVWNLLACARLISVTLPKSVTNRMTRIAHTWIKKSPMLFSILHWHISILLFFMHINLYITYILFIYLSTIWNWSCVLQEWIEGLEQGEMIGVGFLDLKRVYKSIDRNILMEKLFISDPEWIK